MREKEEENRAKRYVCTSRRVLTEKIKMKSAEKDCARMRMREKSDGFNFEVLFWVAYSRNYDLSFIKRFEVLDRRN